MSNIFTERRYFPSDWAQLYATSYGEVCAIIESFSDDLIAREDLMRLYRHQSDAHYERVVKMTEKAAKQLQESTELARPE